MGSEQSSQKERGNGAAQMFDLAMVGEISLDINADCHGVENRNWGGAVVYAAYIAAALGYRVAAVPKSASDPAEVRQLFRGSPAAMEHISVYPAWSSVTTSIRNVYHSEDKEERTSSCISQVEPYTLADIPGIGAKVFCLSGLMKGDIPEELIAWAHRRAKTAVDMQGFLRCREGAEMTYHDWKRKKEYLPMIDYLKADAKEARILTGESDRKKAAVLLHRWGAKEVMISHNTQMLVYDGKAFYTSPVTSRNFSGRTGRGDTVFGAYICERQTASIQEALNVATAAVSLKMETPGPFLGTREDIERYRAEVAKVK